MQLKDLLCEKITPTDKDIIDCVTAVGIKGMYLNATDKKELPKNNKVLNSYNKIQNDFMFIMKKFTTLTKFYFRESDKTMKGNTEKAAQYLLLNKDKYNTIKSTYDFIEKSIKTFKSNTKKIKKIINNSRKSKNEKLLLDLDILESKLTKTLSLINYTERTLDNVKSVLDLVEKPNFQSAFGIVTTLKAKNKVLTENAMLDISIPNLDKVVTNDEKLETFLLDYYRIEEKFDGTKLTLWRNSNEWEEDYRKNWVVSFKNQILYPAEFDKIDRNIIKKYSLGISQYAFIHDHLKRFHKNTKDIPTNTEFFIEFIQNKLTTTRDYKKQHDLFLIAYSPAKGSIEGGMLKTSPIGFFQQDLNIFSEILSLKMPPVVFHGQINSEENFTKGIKNNNLMNAWISNKHLFEKNKYDTIKKTLLSFESILGGKTEGVVLHSSSGTMFKFLQDDQHDKSVRFAKKLRFQNSKEIEEKYWSEIYILAKENIDNIENLNSNNYEINLSKIVKAIYSIKDNRIKSLFTFKFKAMKKEDKLTDDKALIQKIRDDLHLTSKQLLMDKLPENQNALFIGKLRVPTKAHTDIIRKAIDKYNHVIICIVKAKKDNKLSLNLEYQKKILKRLFGEKVTIIEHSTGNLTSIINKSPKRIKFLLTGTDRIESYKGQLKRHPQINMIEIERDEESVDNISATKTIDYIRNNNISGFKEMVDIEIWDEFENIREVLK